MSADAEMTTALMVAAPAASPAPPSARTAVMWAYALTLGRFAISTGVMFVMAALLQPSAYGVMALAAVWVTFAEGLAQHGPCQAVVQREVVTDEHLNAAFWSTFTISGAFAAVFAACAPFWAVVNGSHQLVYVCWAMAPAIVLNSLVAIPDTILRRALRFRSLSIRVVIAGAISGVAGITTALVGWGVWALVVQQLTLAVASLVTVWAIVPWRPRLAMSWPAFRDIRRFSVQSISEYLALFVSTRTDALVLGAFFGAATIGLYRFAARISDTVIGVAAGGLGEVSLPHLSRYSGDKRAFTERLGQMVHAAAVFTVPLFGVLAPCSAHLLAVVGPQWTPATPVLWTLCVSGPFGALSSVLGPAVQAAGRPGASALLGWVKAIVSVGALTTVGAVFAGAGTQAQIVVVAVTFCAIHVLAVTAAVVVTIGLVLRLPTGRVVRPMLPSVAAAAAAAIAGFVVQPLVSGLAPFAALVVTGTVAALAGGAALLLLDRHVSAVVARPVRRALHRA